MDWMKLGADLRLREIVSPNLLLNKEDRHFQRVRLRAWAAVEPMEDLDLNVRLVYEPRHFYEPNRSARTRTAYYIDDSDWTVNEAILDKFNAKWSSDALGLPVTVTVGRQDIILGNGWLVLDGTPLDGSRTIFFDAARATIDLEENQTKVDLIFVEQYADSDRWLRPFGDKDFHNMEQDERGVIAYVTNKSLEKTQLDGFFIYKQDRQVIGAQAGDVGAATWQAGNNGEIYAVGGRVVGELQEDLGYRAEFAHECGHKNGADISAFGVNTRVTYEMKDAKKNTFHADYEYLSGDDPDTATNEQFDPLWGRWPQFSEMLCYTVALENRPGETTNLHRLGVGWACNPAKKLQLKTDYNLLFADKQSYTAAGQAGYFDNDNCFRGHLVTAKLGYKWNRHVSGHLLGEMFFPGNFYSNTRNEVGGFFRCEVTLAW
ncbi:MAG: alginate export family protein [Planctomycetes bacterium]|nr:alginate export family protein [Planctomycetota bacterium]